MRRYQHRPITAVVSVSQSTLDAVRLVRVLVADAWRRGAGRTGDASERVPETPAPPSRASERRAAEGRQRAARASPYARSAAPANDSV